ncbi:hypothetical protein HX362_004600 [Salmonella enterica]|nr:hypothetical protein [Salmonella enterica]
MQLTKRQQQIFDMFLETPSEPRTTGDFTELGVERTTIFRDIKKLVQANLLRQTGKSYRVNPDSDEYLRWDLSRAPYHRESVRYNPALLEDYRPDSTFLLSDDQLMALEQAGQVEGIREAQEKGKSYDRVLVSLLIDLTHASSNLENVPISWLDTKTLIEFGERPDGLTEQQMRIVLNHKAAISYLRDGEECPGAVFFFGHQAQGLYLRVTGVLRTWQTPFSGTGIYRSLRKIGCPLW